MHATSVLTKKNKQNLLARTGGTSAYENEKKPDRSQNLGSGRYGQARAASIATRTQNTRLRRPEFDNSFSDLSSHNQHFDPYQVGEHARTQQ